MIIISYLPDEAIKEPVWTDKNIQKMCLSALFNAMSILASSMHNFKNKCLCQDCKANAELAMNNLQFIERVTRIDIDYEILIPFIDLIISEYTDHIQA